MVFRANKKGKFEETSFCSIIDHINLKDFLLGSPQKKKILTCPVNAIDTTEKNIREQCIDCGLCWIKYPSDIEKVGNPDIKLIRTYLKKDKMFIYTWISLCLNNYSGINIKSEGFSRVKRIPLIIKTNNSLFLVKSVYDSADVEKANYELEDIINLIKEKLKKYNVKKVIIPIIGFDNIKREKDLIIIGFDKIYNDIISNRLQTIEEILK